MAASPENQLRRRILDVTRDLLIGHGITHLSIRMIARRVGCSVGTIYFYFENKDVLVHALIEEGFDKLLEIQEQTEVLVADPLERLQTLCRNYIRFGLDNPEYYEIMFMLKPPQMARYPAEKYRKARRGLEVLSAAIAQCHQSGFMQVHQPFVRAHLIWGFMHGIITLLQAKRIDRSIDRNTLIEETVRQVLTMNLPPGGI